ncbi:hypothetical protein D7Z54_13560 [Salibacterium salarium]|uniref:Uncharacterized protein n=1 Tax=Salibacterium salarium TaxID=284579 RepID=A0A3R9Q3F9_9BACI|nr:hypothetical protein [Salibacterium salarium]RSL32769.1 hypothetical protein D7Z54_13560 [Salibacterium salarium]
MWVYYEEIDGELQPKWVVVEAKQPSEGSIVFYSINQPYDRFYPEDFHDDLFVLSIDIGELLQDPFSNHQFGINIDLVETRLKQNGINPEAIYHAEYFIMLCDDLQEVVHLPTYFKEE